MHGVIEDIVGGRRFDRRNGHLVDHGRFGIRHGFDEGEGAVRSGCRRHIGLLERSLTRYAYCTIELHQTGRGGRGTASLKWCGREPPHGSVRVFGFRILETVGTATEDTIMAGLHAGPSVDSDGGKTELQ